MAEPSKQLIKQAQRLLGDEGDRDAFIEALSNPQPFPPTILWTQPKPPEFDWEVLPPLPWQPNFVDRLAVETQNIPVAVETQNFASLRRPGQHPLHEKGYFYCLDFSSVFAVSAIQAISQTVDVVIDLCAAPGGKSLFAWVALRPTHLLCNEVIRKRVKILISNLKRCGAMEAIVLNLDPTILAKQTPHCAQLVLVDAPCSGQSLLAKGQAVAGCFHKVTVNRNANRQKRILANAAQLVQPEGYLLYSTCTYAPEENEQVGTWLLKKFPEFAPVAVPTLQAYQSPLTELPCYRLWPQSGLGAGAFSMLLRREGGAIARSLNQGFLEEHQFTLYRTRN
ncbi:MAG: RsmB/NOP family class I SAM-dependent RNA methyltransferase [Cyanobacteria bacterium J06639_14]